MVDIFKSAIDAAFGAGSTARISSNIGFNLGGSSANSLGTKSDFTGQIVDVGNIRLRVGNQIAEGSLLLDSSHSSNNSLLQEDTPLFSLLMTSKPIENML